MAAAGALAAAAAAPPTLGLGPAAAGVRFRRGAGRLGPLVAGQANARRDRPSPTRGGGLSAGPRPGRRRRGDPGPSDHRRAGGAGRGRRSRLGRDRRSLPDGPGRATSSTRAAGRRPPASGSRSAHDAMPCRQHPGTACRPRPRQAEHAGRASIRRDDLPRDAAIASVCAAAGSAGHGISAAQSSAVTRAASDRPSSASPSTA